VNPKTFRIRHLVSVGFCLLGFAIPGFVVFYFYFLDPKRVDFLTPLIVTVPQWTPFTVLFWFVSSYVSPILTDRKVGWIVVGLWIFLSTALNFIFLVSTHS
jgi:hypothetical protein